MWTLSVVPVYVLVHSLLTAAVGAQHVSTYTNPAVPTGTPLPGNYTGPLRPQTRYSPPVNWMNDPNGLFRDANGTWHLYFQFDPVNVNGGTPHWGHATSQDLYHWINQQIALFPPVNGTSVFSGTAVVDVNNTSGFFPDQDNGVVAIFTINSPEKENQNIAYSLDGGFTFQYYDGNPVIDSTNTNFRDPQVTWYEDHWVMVVSWAADATLAIYTSPDLKSWSHASNFTRPSLATGTSWECPNMVKLPVRDGPGGQVVDEKYALTISLGSGGPGGSSTIEYIPGGFNGTHFSPDDDVPRVTDWAKDNYAGQYFFSGIPAGSNAINFGWATNLQYAGLPPTGQLEGWRGAMTAPREHYLIKMADGSHSLVSELYDITPLCSEQPLDTASWTKDDSFVVDYSSVESNAIYIDIKVTDPPASGSLDMFFTSPTSGEALHAGLQLGSNGTLFADRSAILGLDDANFKAEMSVGDAVGTTPGLWQTRVLFDRSTAEFFADSGLHTGTVDVYPNAPLTQFNLSTSGFPDSAKVDVVVWALESAWAQFEDDTGIVRGNVTST